MRPILLLQRSLVAKLLVAFVAVVAVGVAIVAIAANQSTISEFDSYLSTGQHLAARQVASTVTQTYGRTGSWDAVARALAGSSPGPAVRVVVANRAGVVVVDTATLWLGHAVTTLSLPAGSPIIVRGENVGTLYVLPGRIGGPRYATPGLSRNQQGSGVPAGRLSQAESAFLAQVNRSLILAAIGASLVALLLGALLARRIARPLGELTRAAQRIAQGSYDERIQPGGPDEVGRLGQAFNRMAESLARTEQARRQVVADVAHELRTPLTVLRGTLQAMRDGVLETDEQNLRTMQEEIGTITRLVTDLHDLSLGDVGQFSLQRHALDLAPVIDQAVAAFGAAASEHQVRLVTEVVPGLPFVQGDADRLLQALRNLIANALRYTPPGGQITVRARAVGGIVEIEVRDTGEGISPEHLPHLFERFYRADPSRARRSGGSGLGLAIVQQIVQAHGGEVTVASDGPGQGTTFTVRLPLAVETAQGNVLHAEGGGR
jgi:signal transduction histidine kinase